MHCAMRYFCLGWLVVAAVGQSCLHQECEDGALLQLSHGLAQNSTQDSWRETMSVAFLVNCSDYIPVATKNHRPVATKVAKQVGDECTSDAECETGICALTWYGFASREYAGDFFDGYALKVGGRKGRFHCSIAQSFGRRPFGNWPKARYRAPELAMHSGLPAQVAGVQD